MPSENPDYQCYLAIIPGETLAVIYKNYGSRLLEQNVRSFLQFTGKVNKKIRKTILDEPQMFLAYNNGIAATAEKVEFVQLSDGTRSIGCVHDFQIVNGGQTTASIFHTQRKDKANIADIYVQVKLTVINNTENIENIVSRISECANTQNKVSNADLTSNHQFHRKLEELSRNIWAPDPTGLHRQSRWFFERARGQYRDAVSREHTPAKKKAFEIKNPRKQMFQKEDLAKYVMSWGMKPYLVARGRQKNYVEFMADYSENLPNDVFFEDSIAKAILFKTSEKEYGTGAKAIGDIRYLVVPYTLAYLNFKCERKINLKKIWNEQILSEEFRQLLNDLMIKINTYLNQEAPRGLIGEWAKKQDCWDKLISKDINADHIDNIKEYLASDSDLDERYDKKYSESSIETKQKLINKIVSLGPRFWDGLGIWSREFEILSQFEYDLCKNISVVLVKNKALRPGDIDKANSILEKKEVNKYPKDYFEKFSEIKEAECNTKLTDTPNFWFTLAKWAKIQNHFNSYDRKLLYNIGKGLDKGWKFSEKQLVRKEELLNEAKEKGFNLESETLNE